ncbi:MAG: carbohydrate binding domain-containing protein [Armatimonadota bacterium]
MSMSTSPRSAEATGYYARILDSLAQPASQAYTPQFRIEREARGWRLFDGTHAIGFVFYRSSFAFDLWSFSPFAPDIMANVDEPGAVYDLHTVHNTFINLPCSSEEKDFPGDGNVFDNADVAWVTDSGSELHLRITAGLSQGQRVQWDFHVTYDASWGQYRYFLAAEAWKLKPNGFEPINMMLAGALTETAEARRWSHSVWEDPNGQLKRLVHSNALFSATDYGDSSGRWRSKNAPRNGAWIAYAADPTFNPAMLVHETNVPIYTATCSQLFDEHLIWQQAGLDELDEGFFHFIMRTELVNIPAGLAQELLDNAADPPVPSQWRTNLVALPFHMETVNSFEEAVDVWQPEDCPVFCISPDVWATDAAHTGTRSLKLTGESYHTWQVLFPGGVVFRVALHTRYRLSGWIKTTGVERFARLELAGYEYTFNNIIDSAATAKVNGDSDWIYVEVELDSGDEAYLMPRLALYGLGTAWFDDLKLEKVR